MYFFLTSTVVPKNYDEANLKCPLKIVGFLRYLMMAEILIILGGVA